MEIIPCLKLETRQTTPTLEELFNSVVDKIELENKYLGDGDLEALSGFDFSFFVSVGAAGAVAAGFLSFAFPPSRFPRPGEREEEEDDREEPEGQKGQGRVIRRCLLTQSHAPSVYSSVPSFFPHLFICIDILPVLHNNNLIRIRLTGRA